MILREEFMTSDILKEVRFFKGLSDEELDRVVDVCTKEEFREGDTIFGEGGATEELFILTKGKASVIANVPGYAEAHEVATIEEGESFGEVSFMDGKPRSATIKCLTDAAVLRLKKSDFYKLVEEHQRIGIVIMVNMIKILCERLRETDRELTDGFKEIKDQDLKSRITSFYSRLRR